MIRSTKDWAWDRTPGLEVATTHYRLLTTVRDAAVVERFCRVMEAAHAAYAALIPPVTADAPLEILLFARPAEWEAYTKLLTGRDAEVYLSVGQGGYTWGDRFVCWLGSESDLWGVAAHEGFHQYVGRHLAWRLPPALEEGLATTFESVTASDTSVTIDRMHNPRRQQGLAAAVDANALIPVDQLVRLHAGDVAGRDWAAREGFYGQCWALARLLEQNPAYARGLARLLAALGDRTTPQAIGRVSANGLYQPAAVRPLLERHVVRDWARFQVEYTRYVWQWSSVSGSRE